VSDYALGDYIVDEVLEGVGKMSNDNTGIPPANMLSMSAIGKSKKVTLKFTPPNNTVVDSQLLCTVSKLMIRRKAGSIPTGIDDGDLVLELAGEDMKKYENKYYEDDGLENGTEYFYRFFAQSDHGVYNLNEENVVSATPKEYTLLGFKIKKSESDPAARVEYTEGAVGLTPAAVNLTTGAFNYGSFGDFWFVTENKPVMVKYDGTEDYELNPNDYTKKKDGTASDVSNTSYGGNCMSKIPLVWLKMWSDTNYLYCNICDIQLDDSYHAYAHQREDGSIMDYIYLSAFEGSLNSSKVRSIKGLTPMNSQAGSNELTYAKANGSLWSTRSWSQRNLINMLLILMAKTTNTQTAYGYGYYTGGSSSSPNYLATGEASDKGQFYGTNATRNYVKVFHIENWWGDVLERIEGCVTNSSSQLLIKSTKPYNTSGSGYSNKGACSGTSGGYISSCDMDDDGLIPRVTSGSETTYFPDGLWFAANCYALVGGYSYDGFHDGAFALNVYRAISNSGWYIGAALSCEQPIAA
jgi:hypothetical protein